MSDPTVDDIMGRLVGQVTHTMEEAIDDVADDVRDEIAVPVEYDGSRVIRSKPGEPPRKETGELTDSISTIVDETAPDVVAATVLVEAEHARYLEEGTDRMAPRPFAGPAQAKWEPILTNRLALSTRQLPSQ